MSDFTPEEYRAMLYRFTELDSKDRERIFGCCFLVNVIEKFTPDVFMKKMEEFIQEPKVGEIFKRKDNYNNVVVFSLLEEEGKKYVRVGYYMENLKIICHATYCLSTFLGNYKRVGKNSQYLEKLIEELK